MFRDGHFKKKLPVNIVFNDGGLGDNIARMSAIKFIKEKYTHVEINLIVPDYFQELAKNLVPKITVRKFSEGTHLWVNGHHSLQTRNVHDGLRSHLVDHAFHVLVNKQVQDQNKNYCKLSDLDKVDISRFNLPEKYVIVTTGFTAEVREMLPHVVNELTSYIKKKGYTPVFLGNKQSATGLESQKLLLGNFNVQIDYSKGIDLIDKTTLIEAGKVIAGAKAILGIDNGLLHLAGCTDVAIVGGFTNVAPELRMPYRNNELGWNYYPITPESSLKCRFCQSNWSFMLDVNFTKCYYKENGFDKEIKCVKMMNSLKFINELEKVL